ncbi:C45 family autoproteolytic acyltransferase/hydrolase [Heyndrickxia sporothermodurans]
MTLDELVVKIVEVKGSHYQIGLSQGTQLRELIVNPLMNTNFDHQSAKEKMETFAPYLLDELKGLSESLSLPLEVILEHCSGYNVDFPIMGCTTFVQDHCYIRNYDFTPELYDARLVFCQPENGYASVGFSQQIMGRLDGMNEKGLVVGLHFVNQAYKKEGFLATSIVRMVLESCRSTEEAIQLIMKVPHRYCYNFSVTDRKGKSAIIEATPEKQMANLSQPLLCTNHFEIDDLKSKNRNEMIGSINRKKYLFNLANQNLSINELFKVFNTEKSPLFFHNYKEYFGTLHTVAYSPQDLKVMVGVGQNSDPFIFSFGDWKKGALQLPSFLKGVIQLRENK